MSSEARVALMSGMRFLVGVANLLGAYLMFRSASVRTSTTINALFGSVLPIVFMVIMAIGVTGLKLPLFKISLCILGTALIIWGTR
jgi:hypothetical protein